MDKNFWQERWQRNQIGFHEAQVQALLAAHWHTLQVPAEEQVLVPLCGKSLDMRWLHERGYGVLGIELSAIAIEAFLDGEALAARRSKGERFVRYRADNYALLCGDFFDLTETDVSAVRAVYDRASLIALPPAMRQRYADHMLHILPAGTQILLITLAFDVPDFSSPPFAVTREEIDRLFGARCEIALLESGPTTVKGHAALHSALHLRLR